MTMTAPPSATERVAAGMHAVTLTGRFEAAHRLPHLASESPAKPNRCVNLHGHSWHVSVTLTAHQLSRSGTVVEFGAFKAAMRGWLQSSLDHATILGAADPLCEVLAAHHQKLYVLSSTADPQAMDERHNGRFWSGADWPTVEALATLCAEQAVKHWLPVSALVADHAATAAVAAVRVAETPDNAAEWRRS